MTLAPQEGDHRPAPPPGLEPRPGQPEAKLLQWMAQADSAHASYGTPPSNAGDMRLNGIRAQFGRLGIKGGLVTFKRLWSLLQQPGPSVEEVAAALLPFRVQANSDDADRAHGA